MKHYLFLLAFYLFGLHPTVLVAENEPAELNYFVTVDMQGYARDYIFGRTQLWMEQSPLITGKSAFGKVRLEAKGKFALSRDMRGRVPKGEIHFNLDFTAYEGAYKCVVTGMTFAGRFSESLEKETTEYVSDKSWQVARQQADETMRRILVQIKDHIENLPVYELEPVSIDERNLKIDAVKPVIYLYPELETEVSVEVDFDGELAFTYPAYRQGWKVTAQPDGSLETENGRHYDYLFWEGPFAENDWDLSEGFCVAGAEVVEFFEEKLRLMGLNEREMTDFITFWGPKMQPNAWNMIHFSTQQYTERARLKISPEPDQVIRVFMLYTELDAPVKTSGQELKEVKRKGFTVVEWGGGELPKAGL